MKIETVYDKGNGQINEDALLNGDPIFGVFDGASGFEPYKNEQGQTGAAVASSLAQKIFSTSQKSLIDTAHDANETIGQAMRENNIDTSRKTALWATTAAVVKINNDTFDWLRVGDSFILTIAPDNSFQLLGSTYNHDVENLIMWQELANQQIENIRERLNDHMLKVRNTMNIEYGDLTGEPEMEQFLEHDTIPLANVAHIIIFTDGLLLPKEDPKQPDDFKQFVEIFLESGLKGIQNHIRNQENSDPKCWQYPRFKQHDDIASISLSF